MPHVRATRSPLARHDARARWLRAATGARQVTKLARRRDEHRHRTQPRMPSPPTPATRRALQPEPLVRGGGVGVDRVIWRSALGALLDRFITQRLLWQEAVLTTEFVQSLVQAEKSLQAYFADPSRGLDAETEMRLQAHCRAARHAARQRLRPGRRMIWSSDRATDRAQLRPQRRTRPRAGRRGGDAIRRRARAHERGKAEHQDLKHPQADLRRDLCAGARRATASACWR